MTTALDRTVSWTLDLAGDSWGDERERLRWYEGLTAAAQLRQIALPWAAAALVLILGRPAVLPLALVVGLDYISMFLATTYVRRHRVDPAVKRWTAARILYVVLTRVPYGIFVVGCFLAFREPGEPIGPTTIGAIIGAVIGTVAGVVGLARDTRNRRRREAAEALDAD
jgi:hypothetical protein